MTVTLEDDPTPNTLDAERVTLAWSSEEQTSEGTSSMYIQASVTHEVFRANVEVAVSPYDML